jgi:hypothetical protein
MKIERLPEFVFALTVVSLVSLGEFAVVAAPPEPTSPSTVSPAEAVENAKPAAPQIEQPENKEKAANDQKKDDDLDRQLLRDLLPDLPLDLNPPEKKQDGEKATLGESQSRLPFADELDEAVATMREVSQRLDKLNLSDDTEELQAGIVTNIDALIEKLKNLPPPSSSSSSEKSDQDQSDSDATSQGQKKGSQSKPQQAPQQQNGADSTTGSAAKPQTGKTGESTEQNLRQARERAAALARRRALVDEIWGHLPPAMRERLLNVGSEKLLPKYEDQIRRYYEALAEPDKPGLRR